MTLDKARELLTTQIAMASGYNRNSAKLILAKIFRVHGQAAVDQLIREMDLETAFGLKAGEKLLSDYHSESVKEACKKISATDFGLTAGIRDYLPHMYGAAAYTVINEVQQLPLKVSDIYRRLTT